MSLGVVRGYVKRVDRLFGFRANGDARMEELGENFNAGAEARAGAREIGVRIYVVNLVVADGGHFVPPARKSDRAILRARLFGTVTAGSDDEDLGLGDDEVFKRKAERGGTQFSENVAAAGEFYHLGNPVSADIDGLEPFEKSNAWAANGLRDFAFDGGEACSDGFEEMLSFVAAHGFVPNPKDVTPDVAEIERIEGQYLRSIIKRGQDRRQVFRRGRANAAQILRNNEVRGEAFQSFGIHGIHAFASGCELADHPVDFERSRIFGNARVNDNGLGACGRRVVAFVADTNHLLTQAEGK